MFATDEGEFIVEDVQNGWHVQAWIELRQGAPWITELRLRSANGSTLRAAQGQAGPREDYTHEWGRKVPAGGITSDVPRSLRYTALYDAIGKDDASKSMLERYGLSADSDFVAVRRPGRRGRDDTFYAVWAARYLAVCETTRRPYPLLAQAHPKLRERAIRDFVNEARRRGLLLGSSAGRSGGRLSAKAERLLDQMKGDGK